jgi:TPR repeat protein
MLARPLVSPGPLRELKDLLYALYTQAGGPSLDRIAQDIADDNGLCGAPERDTIRRCIGSPELPANQHDVVAVATVLARAACWDVGDAADRSRRLWVAAKLVIPLGRSIRGTDPLTSTAPLSRRGAGDSWNLAQLRPWHDQLGEVVQAAVAGVSRIAVLVGESSTGKTRACWETLPILPDGWRLWHPRTAEHLLGGLKPSGSVTGDHGSLAPRTVIWLNELQRYLLPSDASLGVRIAVALRDLLTDRSQAPVLVLGTIWLDWWGALITEPLRGQPDPHEQSRKLLSGCAVVVPDAIGDDRETAQLAATADPRWRLALEQAPDRPIQYLAGAAYLLERYSTAPPAARAVLDAAGDARRIGAPRRLPLAFLERAARDYLPDTEWRRLPRDQRSAWVRNVIENPETGLAMGGRGVDGPLREPRPDADEKRGETELAYELADYLEQHLRRSRATIQPRDSLWNAVATTLGGSHLLTTIARVAEDMGRYRPAARVYGQAAAAGSSKALVSLARIWTRAGDTVGANDLLHEAAAAGDTGAMWELADQRESVGDIDGAEKLLREAAAAGEAAALTELARIREEAGDISSAEQFYRDAMAHGDHEAYAQLALMHEEAGDCEVAEQVAREAVIAGVADVLGRLAEFREESGDGLGAERIAEQAAAAGEVWGLTALGCLREEAGDTAAAEHLYQRAMDGGDEDSWIYLIELRAEAGNDAAELLAEEAWADGDTRGLLALARVRMRLGDVCGAEILANRALGTGEIWPIIILMKLREKAGDRDGAERLAQQAGRVGALADLAEMREGSGDIASAERLYQLAAATGLPDALIHLERLRDAAGDPHGAEQIRRFGITVDGRPESR